MTTQDERVRAAYEAMRWRDYEYHTKWLDDGRPYWLDHWGFKHLLVGDYEEFQAGYRAAGGCDGSR